MSDREKIAAEVPAIMQAASQHLTKLAGENVSLIKRAEAAETENRVMKLARRLEQRGLHTNLSFEEKVAQLSEVPSEKLATMEQAVEMAAGGVRLGNLQEADNSDTKVASDSSSDELDSFIESQAALT